MNEEEVATMVPVAVEIVVTMDIVVMIVEEVAKPSMAVVEEEEEEAGMVQVVMQIASAAVVDGMAGTTAVDTAAEEEAEEGAEEGVEGSGVGGEEVRRHTWGNSRRSSSLSRITQLSPTELSLEYYSLLLKREWPKLTAPTVSSKICRRGRRGVSQTR